MGCGGVAKEVSPQQHSHAAGGCERGRAHPNERGRELKTDVGGRSECAEGPPVKSTWEEKQYDWMM